MPRTCNKPYAAAEYSVQKLLISSIAGLLSTALLTLGTAFLLQRELLPISSCSWLGPVIVALSAFCAAWLSARRSGKKLICGLLTAVIYGLVLYVAGMLLFSAPILPGRIVLSAGALLAGALAGIILSAVGE